MCRFVPQAKNFEIAGSSPELPDRPAIRNQDGWGKVSQARTTAQGGGGNAIAALAERRRRRTQLQHPQQRGEGVCEVCTAGRKPPVVEDREKGLQREVNMQGENYFCWNFGQFFTVNSPHIFHANGIIFEDSVKLLENKLYFFKIIIIIKTNL